MLSSIFMTFANHVHEKSETVNVQMYLLYILCNTEQCELLHVPVDDSIRGCS